MMRLIFLLLTVSFSSLLAGITDRANAKNTQTDNDRFNILIAIADDASYPHMGIYGYPTVETPAFDKVAKEGILFHNVYVASPGCAPSRSSIHTGRFPWQNEEAGGHQTLFPLEYVTYPDVLEEAGYFIGYTGKGVAPFNIESSGRDRNPAGPAFNDIGYSNEDRENIPTGIRNNNYAANFESFLEQRPNGDPFYFWYGASEPHRTYDDGSGLRSGKRLEDAEIPGFYPESEVIRSDLLDYSLEIDWFDSHLMKMITKLEEIGELDNTLIIITADNGMPFPRAKSNHYDAGLRVPMAVSWPAKIKGGREVHDFISLADIAPTLLDLTKIAPGPMKPMSAKSFANILMSDESGIIDPSREMVFAGRERHSSARWANLGYPQRSVRTNEFLYIRNLAPERWPAGAPQMLDPENPDKLYYMHGVNDSGKFTGNAYFDIDASPTKSYLIENHDIPGVSLYFDLAMGKRPGEELYDVKNDPDNLHNLADDPAYADDLARMREKLYDFLKETEDPRIVGPVPDVFENHQRFSRLRAFPQPDWMKDEYKTDY